MECVSLCEGGVSLVIYLLRNLVGLKWTFTLPSCDHQPEWQKINSEGGEGERERERARERVRVGDCKAH